MLVVQNEALLDLLRFHYTSEKVRAIRRELSDKGVFSFPTLNNGLFPAASVTGETAYTGYASVWVRDNVHIAHAHYVLGEADVAARTACALMDHFRKQCSRCRTMISRRGVSPKNVMCRPHIRFDGLTLGDIDEKWPHAQNDALGYFIWFYSKLACKGLIKPEQTDLDTLWLLAKYLKSVAFWKDEDSGHWEEIRKISASSIGAVVAGLLELRRLWTSSPLNAKHRRPRHLLDELIAKGRASLRRILPAECIQAKSPQRRRYDAALLFLIYPLEVITGKIADRVLQDVLENLQGDHGVRRYVGDSYWAPDYKKKVTAEKRTIDYSENMVARDTMAQRGNEAQWCIFDPIISAIYGLRYQATRNGEFFRLQTKYLNRSLGQLTSPDSGFPEWRCPELYYIEDGRRVPSDATPLLWTQANLMLALKVMRDSVQSSGDASRVQSGAVTQEGCETEVIP
ncbi:MAG: glycoside hydrolase family 15 protein [Bacillota bacterium]